MAPSPGVHHPLPQTAGRGLLKRILSLEPLWVLLCFPLLILPGRFVPGSWQPWIVLLAFLFWPLRWRVQGSVLFPTPVRLAVLFFLLCIPLPVLVTTDPALTWEALGYLVLGIVMANAAIGMPLLQRSPKWIAYVLALGGTALALLGPLVIAESSLGAGLMRRLAAAAGPVSAMLGETINPNILANALLAVLPFAAAFALRGDALPRRWMHWLAVLATLLMVAVIYLSESRGALLALAVLAPLLIILRFPRLLWMLPVLLVVAALFFAFGGTVLLDALTSGSTGSATSGFAERVELWQHGIYAIQDFPITGIGLGTYGTVVPFLYPFLLISPNVFLPDAHNLPIQVGVDLGIPGLVTWLAMLFCLFGMMAYVLRRTRDPMRWALAAGVTVSFVGYLVAGVFAATNWGVKPAFLPWIVGALGVLVHRQQWLEECADAEETESQA